MGKVIKEAVFEYSGKKQSASGIAKPFGENDRQNIAGFLYNGKRPAQNFGLIRPTTRPSTGNDRQDVLSFINQNKRPAQTLEFHRPINLPNQSSGTQSSLNPLIYKGDVNNTGYNYVKGNPLARGGQQSSAATFVRKESIQPAQTTTIDRSQFARSGTATTGSMTYQGTTSQNSGTTTIDRSQFARSGTATTGSMTYQGTANQSTSASATINRSEFARSGTATTGSMTYQGTANQSTGASTTINRSEFARSGTATMGSGSWATSIPYTGSMPQPVWQSHFANPLARAGGVIGAAAGIGAVAANADKGKQTLKDAINNITKGISNAVGGEAKITFDIEAMLDIVDGLEEIVMAFNDTIVPASEKIAKTDFYVNGSAKDACKALEQVTGKTAEIMNHYYRASGLVTKAVTKAQETDKAIAEAISARYSNT